MVWEFLPDTRGWNVGLGADLSKPLSHQAPLAFYFLLAELFLSHSSGLHHCSLRSPRHAKADPSRAENCFLKSLFGCRRGRAQKNLDLPPQRFSHSLSRNPSSCPRRLEIKTPCDPVDIQNLARKIKPGTNPALHR